MINSTNQLYMNSFLAPFKESVLLKIIIAIISLFYSFIMNAQVEKSTELFKILAAKDSILFVRTFNNCEIEKLDPIIADNFEFYHDVVGIQNKNVCKSYQKQHL